MSLVLEGLQREICIVYWTLCINIVRQSDENNSDALFSSCCFCIIHFIPGTGESPLYLASGYKRDAWEVHRGCPAVRKQMQGVVGLRCLEQLVNVGILC